MTDSELKVYVLCGKRYKYKLIAYKNNQSHHCQQNSPPYLD